MANPDQEQNDIPDDWRSGGFGLYVHWPFCESKCPYCDFNSHVAAHIPHDRWLAAYTHEIDRIAAMVPDRRLDSIFFGGGTPSLMDPATVDAIVSTARKSWKTGNTLEVTLEANPTSVEAGRFMEFSGAGVSRVSLGVQSLRDESLKLLGRRHTAAEAMKAWDIANGVFDRTSLDVIYARQKQGFDDWKSELTEVLQLKPRHMSLYQLTIETGTVFWDRYFRGKLPGLPDEDLGADLYGLTQDLCSGAGLLAYEVSNHAWPGNECRHNLIYWRYGDYAGIGPGAHGRLTLGNKRYSQESQRDPSAWLRHVEARDGRQSVLEELTREDQGVEYLLMSLRLSEGMEIRRFETLAGGFREQDGLIDLLVGGFLWRTKDRIGTTAKGRPVLNSILRELV